MQATQQCEASHEDESVSGCLFDRLDRQSLFSHSSNSRKLMPFVAQNIKQARLHLQKSDPVMKRLLKQVGPFTAKAKRDRFATLVSSIISQQISTAAARTIKGRLVEGVAKRASRFKQTSTALTAKNLLLFEVDELRELGVSRQKATYVLDLAHHVDSGDVDLKSLGRLTDQDVIQRLTQVKGIGVWTAQMFLMFSLARMDILPTDDLGIRNAIEKQYELEAKPTADQIETIASNWRPYATVACWYLWQSLEEPS
jgi:DNA-3-methyladenine glycosylase II